MKIVADTNVLARVILQDDEEQFVKAAELLRRATSVAIATSTLCELVWILQKNTKLPRTQIIATLQTILNTDTIVINRPAVEAGLAT